MLCRPRHALLLLALMIAALMPGCDTPPSAADAAVDRGSSLDLRLADAADAAAPADLAADLAPADAPADLAPADATADLAPADLAADLTSADASADLGPTDATTDASALPLPGLGTISGACGELDDGEWQSASPYLFRNAIDFGSQSFDPALLSSGGQQIYIEGNRGGSSLHSEIFAYEVLYRCELAQLLKTESKITYADAGGKKTDLLLEIDARKIGVSVTRAYHYPPTTPYTVSEATALLDKKLSDLPLSQSNALPADAWIRSVLHVLAYDDQYADAVQQAWNTQVSAQLKGDAILLLTVTHGNDGFIY